MRPLTYTRPKPLLPLLNQPLLQTIIDRLPKSVETICLPVNYLREQVEAYFEAHPDPRVVLVEERDPLGTGGAIKNCETHLTGPFLVYNGDCVASIDLDRFREAHERTGARATVSLWPVEEPWHFGVVELAPDGRISRFVEKPPRGQEPSNLINAGHYLLDPSILDEFVPRRPTSIEREVFERWARERQGIFGYRFEGYWIDCGRPELLLEAHETLLRQSGKSLVKGAGCQVASRASVTGYALGDGCTVAAGAQVDRCILFDGVRVGTNVVARDSILGEGVEVEDGAVLERSVVGDYGVIEAASEIRDQRIGLRPEDVVA